MKTALISVDPVDDLAALTDKIAWAKAPRAMLLWPSPGCAVQRSLDFVRLRRAADALGTQIAIITRTRGVRRLASAAHIPVFTTRQEALHKAWRWRPVRTQRRRVRRNLQALRALARRPIPWDDLTPRQRWAVFAVGLWAVVILAAFVLPGAQITLTPRPTVRRLDVQASLAPASPTSDLPARWVAVTVSGSASRPVSGHAPLPARPATVSLTFTNLTTDSLTLPAGTRVGSFGQRAVVFATTRAGTLPGKVGATLRLPARALQRGALTNRPAHDVVLVAPPFTFRVLADNPHPASGGSDRRVPAPSNEDYRRLEAELRAQLATQALAKMQQQYPHALVVLPSLEAQTDLERAFDPPDGQPANRLRLNLRTRYHVLLVPQEALQAWGRAQIAAKAPAGMTLATLQVTPDPAGPQAQGAGFTWMLHITAAFSPPIEADAVRRLVHGRTPEGAARALQAAFSLAAPPEIRRWPAWWPWLPWLPLRIRVNTAPPLLAASDA